MGRPSSFSWRSWPAAAAAVTLRGNMSRAARSTLLVLATWVAGCAASPPPHIEEPVRLAATPRAPELAEPEVLPPPAPTGPKADRLVIVTLDGVRWQEIFHGVDPELARAHRLRDREIVSAEELTPNLHQAMKGALVRGDTGAEMVASGPNFASLPGYVELLSGAPATCQRNDCPRETRRTILDACREAPDTKPDGVAMIASWETLENAATADEGTIVLSIKTYGSVAPRPPSN